MDTKLTLTLDHDVIERAKLYAKEKKRSLSDLVENYFRALTLDTDPGDFEVTETVESLHGSLRSKAEY